ncbi:BTAD domain-containing putative transcriptional regulator [Amycolatopsis keratiniphila]|uniref:BTAD domain-containing putative transcriptional regulator n=1 Tax=Amycolatopsis keratiniphila TaxID=129921 RepID=UPI00087C1B77|nr:BTAD domain-containing putative transcriptional regulator [Amycolatopsis keratiniphila]OLZ49758.1 transcriptional regulator [Amycolatopsis keratiniphila subsp. nogabecina]SDU23801.1 DNA-binding transcriptional activator of the SARP family [Amycolatopsis keratiniphila]
MPPLPQEVRYRFTVLGPPGFTSGGTRLDLGSPQQQAVLMLLLANAGSFVRTGELIDGLWGERAPATGEAVIRTYISRLRRLLSLQGLGSAIVSRSGGYRMDPDRFEVDAVEFAGLIESARQARSVETAAKLLERALGLWTGTALAGVPGEAAEHERSRLERLKLTATQELLRLRLELGEHDEVVAEVPALIERNRLEEPLYEIYLLALHRGGRRAEALELYRSIHDLFDAELGVRPGPKLRALHQKVLRAEDERTPTPRGPDPLFVGRERERAEFRRLLARGGVLFLTGAPGIGKSTLIRKFADDAASVGRPVRLFDGLDDPAETLRRLPGDVTAVIAGRTGPDATLLVDPAWSGRITIRKLEPLSDDESAALLEARGVGPDLRKSIVDFAAGNPFALSLAAEVSRSPQADAARYVVDTLYAHLAGDPPTEAHRWALYVCAQADHTTEDLLRSVLPGGRSSELFDWLRDHACVEAATQGLVLGGVLREVLDRHLAWRDPAGRARIRGRIGRVTTGR